MNDIIQDLEVNATNGKENFCYISEKQLKAMKELSKREAKENKQLKDNWNKLKKDIAYELLKLRDPNEYNNGLFNAFTYINNEIQELEQGSDN